MRIYFIAVTRDLFAPLPFCTSYDSALFELIGNIPVFDCVTSFVFLFAGIRGTENESVFWKVGRIAV